MKDRVKTRRRKSQEYLQSNVDKLKKNQEEYMTEKIKMMEDFLNIYKKKASDIGSESKEKLVENSSKLQDSIK